MEPVRTCVGCRSRSHRSALMRLVVQESQVVADDRAALPGRGAWLHPDIECFRLAEKKRAFTRAFRVRNALDTNSLENRLNG